MKTFLSTILVMGVAALTASAQDINSMLAGSFKGPVGLQLYSMRDSFNRDVPGTLDKIKQFGFVDVELAGNYNETPEQFHKELVDHGLKAIGGHFSYDRYKNDPEGVAKEAQIFGMKYAGCAWIPHKGAFTEQDCREAAKVLNHAGEVLASHGIKFYLHTHGYEFQPYADGTLFDLLMHETNPRYVSFEMDVMWVVFPGQDPVKLLYKYGPRWKLMHLKDPRKGIESNLSGGTNPNNDVVLGTGQADWPEILKAAKKVGVKYYFIEDESKSVIDQIPQHLNYLEHVSW